MREIKFRVWNEENGMYILQEINPCVVHHNGILMSFINEFDTDILSPKDYTLEQYTGLKDMEGKEIYDGDILKTSLNFSVTSVICFGGSSLVLCEKDRYRHLIEIYESCSVIGNIHENPELLEKK